MNKQEYEKELAELKERIAFLEQNKPEEVNGTWKPKINSFYLSIDVNGDIISSTWYEDGIDNSRFSIGNVFQTEKEAKFEVERRKVIQELKQFACEFRLGSDNFIIGYDFKYDTLSFYNYRHKAQSLYFSSIKQSERAINAVGYERVKKYYLGVKE